MHFRLSDLPLSCQLQALPHLGSREVSAFDLFLPSNQKVDSVCIPCTLLFHTLFICSSFLRCLKSDHAALLDLPGGHQDSFCKEGLK